MSPSTELSKSFIIKPPHIECKTPVNTGKTFSFLHLIIFFLPGRSLIQHTTYVHYEHLAVWVVPLQFFSEFTENNELLIAMDVDSINNIWYLVVVLT